MAAASCSWGKLPAPCDRAGGSPFCLIYVSGGVKGDRKLPYNIRLLKIKSATCFSIFFTIARLTYRTDVRIIITLYSVKRVSQCSRNIL